MKHKSVDYYCPYQATCSLKKRCHVLSTTKPLEQVIEVRQKCLEEKVKTGGAQTEIIIRIGGAA